MCGRFTMTKKQKQVADRYNAEIEGIINEMYNATPTQTLPVVTNERPGTIQQFRWGLIPSWGKTLSTGSMMINARSETLQEKPAFRKLIGSRRCLIPADGFYEWKKDGKDKQPYRITLKDEELFSIAGLWDEWVSKEGERYNTFTIITTQANDVMSSLHERMPVILARDTEEAWLSADVRDPNEVEQFLRPYPDDEMRVYPVSTRVNNTRNNGPELVEEQE